jgi:immunoglobulin-like protein involved in spore germination/sporulation and spore germination protein
MRGMRTARALLLLLAAPVAAGCGSSSKEEAAATATRPTTTTAPTTAPTGTTASTTTAPAPPPADANTVLVYLLRDGKVAVVRRSVGPTRAVARAALEQLVRGPTPAERNAGFSTAVDPATTIDRLTVAGGVATLDTPRPLRPDAELAQVVYTLTQFPTVRRVSVVLESNDAVEVGRGDFEDATPPILVESPAPGDRVTSPLRVRGTANTFEATFLVELREQDGSLLAKKVVTATSGSGTRGTFDVRVPFTVDRAGLRELVAYEIDADSGRRTHVVRVPLVLVGA